MPTSSPRTLALPTRRVHDIARCPTLPRRDRVIASSPRTRIHHVQMHTSSSNRYTHRRERERERDARTTHGYTRGHATLTRRCPDATRREKATIDHRSRAQRSPAREPCLECVFFPLPGGETGGTRRVWRDGVSKDWHAIRFDRRPPSWRGRARRRERRARRRHATRRAISPSIASDRHASPRRYRRDSLLSPRPTLSRVFFISRVFLSLSIFN